MLITLALKRKIQMMMQRFALAAHSAPFALSRTAMMIFAPRDANALLNAKPRPLLAPVIMMFLPFMSSMWPLTTSVLLVVDMLAGRDAICLEGATLPSGLRIRDAKFRKPLAVIRNKDSSMRLHVRLVRCCSALLTATDSETRLTLEV